MTDQSKWVLDVCANDGSHPAGSGQLFNTLNKSYNHSINSGKTMSCSINTDNPRADWMWNTIESGGSVLMKVYRRTRSGTKQLLMVGDIVQLEETGAGSMGQITITAADPFWRLQHRVLAVGVDSLGRGIGLTIGTPSVMIDMGAMILFIVNLLNSGFYTGIAIGTNTASTNSVLGPVYASYSSDIIQQICASGGGPDFEIVPNEPTGAWPGTTIGTINTVPHLGTIPLSGVPPAVTFEYGTGRSTLASYDRLLTRQQVANTIWSTPQGFPTLSAAGDTTIDVQDATSLAAIGQFDYLLASDVTTLAMRTELITEALGVMKSGQQQLTFQPTVDCPHDYGQDYKVGDIVGAMAKDPTIRSVRFNGTTRLYGVQITADENDADTTQLTLIPSQVSDSSFSGGAG